MRVLIDAIGGRAGDTELSEEATLDLYRPTQASWWRINMVSTVDGAATGATGTSGSINNGADKRVFELLRGLADAILVGAGTARHERYGPAGIPIVLVSRSGQVPEKLRDLDPGRVLLATTSAAGGLAESRELLGDDNVIVSDDEVDLAALRLELDERGLRSVLSEGGPRLFADLAGAGVLDEVCLTLVPQLVGGPHPRIVGGADLDVPLRLATLVEEDGTLLGRWAIG